MIELLYKDEVYAIIGAAMEVYNTLGPGFVEPVYREAFGIEMAARSIRVKPQQEWVILYKGKPLQTTYIADYVAFEKIVIEIKALDRLTTQEEAQLLNNLRATKSPLGLPINFGAMNDLEWKHMAATSNRPGNSHRPLKYIRED